MEQCKFNNKYLIMMIFIYFTLFSCSHTKPDYMFVRLLIHNPREKPDTVIVLGLKEREKRSGYAILDTIFDGVRYSKINMTNSLEGYQSIFSYVGDWYANYNLMTKIPFDSTQIIKVSPYFINCDYCKNKDSIFFRIIKGYLLTNYRFSIKYQPGDTVTKEIYLEKFKLEN